MMYRKVVQQEDSLEASSSRNTNNSKTPPSSVGGGVRHRRAHQTDREQSLPESLNFTEEQNEVWRTKQAQLLYTNRNRWWTSQVSTKIKRWVITSLVGVLTAFTAIFITAGTGGLTRWKFATVRRVMDREELGLAAAGSSFFVYAGFNLAYVSIAALMVWIEPVAAGSGIPEVKCFLNGIDIPRIVAFRTLMCKSVGVLFSVSAALPAGKEGPMIHSGSVIASVLAQGFTRSSLGAPFGKGGQDVQVLEFRNDLEKRDFVACGASAGVAAAFSAPIGGVLFALEEGASFWSTALTWRSFFCAMVTLYTLYVVRSSKEAWGPNTEMFSFGRFTSSKEGQVNFALWELLLFTALGGLGGLAGALFNGLNRRLTLVRGRYAKTKKAKVVEALAVCFVCSFVNYMIPLFWTKCTRKPVVQPSWTPQEAEVVNLLVRFKCPPGFYNEVASLFFTNSDAAIKQLFHFREAGVFKDDGETFSSLAIAIFYVPYFCLACLTYGLAVPSGLFVPSLLSGAAMGRLCGHLLHRLDGQSGTFADSGTYSLVGAAAGLGGMARMTISLTVILLEATGNVQNLLPIMLSLLAARSVGNLFNVGLYDIHIRLKRLPYLEENLPDCADERGGAATAASVMTPGSQMRSFPPLVTVGQVMDTLETCAHEAFPVVSSPRMASSSSLLQRRSTSEEEVEQEAETKTTPAPASKAGPPPQLVGVVLRSTLSLLIDHRAYAPPGVEPSSQRDLKTTALSPLLSSAVFERAYPSYPAVEDLRVDDQDRDCWLDLRPYADTAPFTVQECASVHRTYRTFRTMGLRHLFVVDVANRLKGVITRKDLDHQSLERKLGRAPDSELDSYQIEATPSSMARFALSTENSTRPSSTNSSSSSNNNNNNNNKNSNCRDPLITLSTDDDI